MVLRTARRRAGLTQRKLASIAAVPQSVVARIESGGVVPRVDTLDRLLEACGEGLESVPRPGIGADRTLAWELLELSIPERLRRLVESSRAAARLSGRAASR